MKRSSTKGRAIILSAAGLLLGATTLGWVQNSISGQHKKASTIAVAASSTVPVAPPAVVAVGQPVTRLSDISVSVRQSAGREDPTAPISEFANTPVVSPTVAPVVAEAPAAPELIASRPTRKPVFEVPPPPVAYNGPISADGTVGYVVPAPEQPVIPLRDAVRLVGILDGKAFFSVPSDIARANDIGSNFTAAVGQTYGGLTIEKIGERSVNIRDGRHVLTKELGLIR